MSELSKHSSCIATGTELFLDHKGFGRSRAWPEDALESVTWLDSSPQTGTASTNAQTYEAREAHVARQGRRLEVEPFSYPQCASVGVWTASRASRSKTIRDRLGGRWERAREGYIRSAPPNETRRAW